MPDDLRRSRDAFVERVGRLFQRDGLPPNAGRIFGFLLFEGGEVSFGTISQTLGISRGGVSMATRMMEERGLLLRTGRAGDRQDWFRLVDDPFARMLRVEHGRTLRAAEEIERAIADLPDDAVGPRRRIQGFADLHRRIADMLARTIETTRPEEP
jgi:DNA-binding transcriptional regulator GbsR (MarR family)